jgi:hypothetical protein
MPRTGIEPDKCLVLIDGDRPHGLCECEVPDTRAVTLHRTGYRVATARIKPDIVRFAFDWLRNIQTTLKILNISCELSFRFQPTN